MTRASDQSEGIFAVASFLTEPVEVLYCGEIAAAAAAQWGPGSVWATGFTQGKAIELAILNAKSTRRTLREAGVPLTLTNGKK